MNTDSPRKQRWVAWVAVLSLLLGLVGAGAVFCVWKRIQATQRVDDYRWAAWQQSQRQIQGRLVAQNLILESDRKNLQQLLTQSQAKNRDWVMSEANNLVQRAAFSLRFEDNIKLAKALLQAADARIASLGYAANWPLREAVIADITQLDAVPEVDLPGIMMQLNALNAEVEHLPQSSVPAVAIAVEPPKVNAATGYHWEAVKNFALQVLKSLKSLIVIHHDTARVAPLLPPDAYPYVVANIQSQLAMASWAALHHQQAVYRAALETASKWISRYFSTTDASVQGVLKHIQTLQAIEVSPSLPPLTRSLNAVAHADERVSS